MTSHGWMVLGVYLIILLLLARPLGIYIYHILEGRSTLLRFGGRMESLFYRLSGIEQAKEMTWLQYTLAILLFNGLGVIAVYGLQRLQLWLLLNPQKVVNVTPDSAFNTSISFVTNTNWQGYSGEVSMSYLTQMLGLGVQNFLSAATGIAVAVVLMRGFARHTTKHVGNAWVDITRVTFYLLLPLSTIYAIFLVSQGVIQNVDPYREATTLEAMHQRVPTPETQGQSMDKVPAVAVQTQRLPMGPVASQEAIKMLGTNGGGFLNANSAHPFENPTPLSNFVQMLSIFLIPAALCFTFGRMVEDVRQGRAILIVMIAVFVVMAVAVMSLEQQGNPLLNALGIDQRVGNLEGKEVRFGSEESSLFATITTLASCGAVNAMHDSFTPLGGMVLMMNMMLGEVIFGGVGSGLYGILIFAMLAVFIAGLMIGRTPEYLGKKIESYEMKMLSLAILVTPLLVLFGTAIAVMVPAGVAGIANPGAHGFSEILYAFTSAANNNGSAFAGLSANTPFYNTMLAIAMWFGRFGVIIPVLAIAGSLAAKKRMVTGSGTMPTHGPLFVVLLIGTIFMIGALNYVPALALGPMVEELILRSAQ